MAGPPRKHGLPRLPSGDHVPDLTPLEKGEAVRADAGTYMSCQPAATGHMTWHKVVASRRLDLLPLEVVARIVRDWCVK